VQKPSSKDGEEIFYVLSDSTQAKDGFL